MAYNPVNPNGQASSANSAPVVIANDQSAVPVTLSGSTSQTKITDGTNVVNVLKSDGTAVGQNAQFIAPTYKEVGSLTAGALNADLVPSTDVSGYATFMLQIVGTFVGTLTLQGSNDNTNFVSVYGTWINNSQPTTTATTTGIISGSCNFRYLRVRMTAYTSGTATGTLELKTMPFAPTNITGQISSTSTPVTARNTGNITTSSSSISSTSATGFSWAYVTISGTYAGISFGITASDNGGTTYYNVPVWDVQNQKYIAPGTTITLTDNSSSSYYVPQSASTSVVRVLSSAYTSGTGAVAITGMSNTPFLPPTNSATTTPVTARATGNITSAISSVASVSATGFSWALVTIHGSYTGIKFGITASDDGSTTYYNVPIWDVQNNKYIAPGSTISPADNSSASFIVPQSSTTSVVRVLASAWTSGTGVIGITGQSNSPAILSTEVNNSAVAGVGMQTASNSILNTLTAIKASGTNTPSTLYGWYFFNNNSTVAYCQIFDVSSTGSATLGTTAPTMSFGIPAFGGANAFPTQGIKFSNGIVIAMTTTRAGSTAPTTSVDYNIFYQ